MAQQPGLRKLIVRKRNEGQVALYPCEAKHEVERCAKVAGSDLVYTVMVPDPCNWSLLKKVALGNGKKGFRTIKLIAWEQVIEQFPVAYGWELLWQP